MYTLKSCIILLTILFTVNGYEQPRVATTILTPRSNDQQTQNITGTVVFSEMDYGLRITGHISGMSQGKYGFHVHELGDISTCYTSGAHFNPDGTTHGDRVHEIRHVGDLGNIEFTSDGEANINITDHVLTLRGRNTILGRTLVLHAEEDDLGLGGDEGSLTTGNAGARVACGVIGLRFPADPWNSAVTSSPSLLLFISAALVAYFYN